MEQVILTVGIDDNLVRIDKFICSRVDSMSRSFVQKIINDDLVILDDRPVNKNYIVKKGDVISFIIPQAEPIDILPENIHIDVEYEDDHLLVVNKPKGMVVHPAPGNYTGTLVNALLFYCGHSLSGINGVIRPGIVHRIDKDTSGLLMVAKNDFSHRLLSEQIKSHSFKREYEAVVHGRLKNDSGVINAPIGRHPIDRKKMAVTYKSSREAVTHYKVLKRYNSFTHVRLSLETGRTHQIRVHMSYIGHPIAGDRVYGALKGNSYLDGQCLHARTLGFIHPVSECYVEFTSSLPEYFLKFIDKLNNIEK